MKLRRAHPQAALGPADDQTGPPSAPAPIEDLSPVVDKDEGLRLLLAPSAADRITPSRRRLPHYSQVVSWSKIALPAIAVVLAALVIIWPQLERAGDDAFSFGISTISERGVNLEQVVNARFFGTDTDRQPYSVTADLAEETEPGSRVVRLDHPQADIALNDGAWMMMTAQEGLYHQQSSLLQLRDNVSVFHDGGYELHTESASIDMPAGMAQGESPIQAQGPFGTLTAEGFIINRQAKTVTFTGKAHLVLRDNAATIPAPAPLQEER
jgi:lipopolysaccharide export system protein LptC